MNTPGADEIFMIPWNILQWVLGVIRSEERRVGKEGRL